MPPITEIGRPMAHISAITDKFRTLPWGAHVNRKGTIVKMFLTTKEAGEEERSADPVQSLLLPSPIVVAPEPRASTKVRKTPIVVAPEPRASTKVRKTRVRKK